MTNTNKAVHAPDKGATPINYCLESEVSITFLCQLVTHQYESKPSQKAPL